MNFRNFAFLVGFTFLALPSWAEVRFDCEKKSEMFLGCYFKIKAGSGKAEFDFELTNGEYRVLSDEFYGREFCYGFAEFEVVPGTTEKLTNHEAECYVTSIIVQERNRNAWRPPPVPGGQVWFMCRTGFTNEGCKFAFAKSDVQPPLVLMRGEERFLSAALVGSLYCASPNAVAGEPKPLSFDECQKTSKGRLVQLLNDDLGTDYNATAPEPNEPVGFVPKHLLKQPESVMQCVTLSLPPPGDNAYLMFGYFVNSKGKMTDSFTGIPSDLDAARLKALCAGKWYLDEGSKKPTNVSDIRIPTREGLKAEIEFNVRRVEVLANGYYLHVHIQSYWYALYQELYYEAKVTKKSDPDGEPLDADELRIVWKHGSDWGQKNCGRTSICALSDRIYSTSIFGPGDVCMTAVSVLAGLTIGAELPKGKQCIK